MAETKKEQGVPEPPKVEDLDLSAAGNLEAAAKKDPQIKEIAEKSPSRKKSGKFNFIKSELIPLPSKGRLYKPVCKDPEVVKKGMIRMKPMTVKEEEILSTPRFLKAGIATRMILERCIDSDIDAKDILLFDSNFLMFYLRSISYGDEYHFELQCTNATCEKKFDHVVNITKLAFDELDDEVKEPIKVKLPISQYTVEAILPRLYHTEEIYTRNSNRKKSTQDSDQRLLDNMLVTTLAIYDEEGNEVDESDWVEFYEALPGADSGTLREKFAFSTNIDEIKDIECPYCNTEFDGSIPMGPEFFRF